MQLCALDHNHSLVFAHQAVKHQNYICLECGQRVRLRRGAQRQAHYYHSEPNQACRQSGKGMAHLLVQHFIKERLPDGEAHLEYRFPSIGRIADVVWVPRRLVYEIQYSPITAVEVEARNRDYASLGYQVVWVFFDGRYNQTKMSAAEDIICTFPHYFTNMDEEGNGMIYDQFALVERGVRKHVLSRLPVDPAGVCGIHEKFVRTLQDRIPQSLLERISQWKLHFAGDSIAHCLGENESADFMQEVDALMEKQRNLRALSLWKGVRDVFQQWVGIPYRAVLRLLLERACR